MIEHNQCDHDENNTPEMAFNYIPLLELPGLRNIFPKKKSSWDLEQPLTFTKSQIIDVFLKHPEFLNEDDVHIFPSMNKYQELQFFCLFCKKGMWDFKIVNNNTIEPYFKQRSDDMPSFLN